jgi:hypothetical protein
MWRFLMLLAVSVPFLWTAYDEWHTVTANPPASDLPPDAVEKAKKEAETAKQLRTEVETTGKKAKTAKEGAIEGYQLWGAHLFGNGDGKPREGWEEFFQKTKDRVVVINATRKFADSYRRRRPNLEEVGNDERFNDERFQEALKIRQIEVDFLKRMKETTLIDELKTDLEKYRKDHKDATQVNWRALDLLDAWILGNTWLVKYAAPGRRVLFLQLVKRTKESPEEPFGDEEWQTLANEKREREAFSKAVDRLKTEVGPDKPVDKEAEEWRKLRELARRIDGPQGEAELWSPIREQAESLNGLPADDLKRIEYLASWVVAGSLADDQARQAAGSLCAQILARHRPNDPAARDFDRKRDELLDTKNWSDAFLKELGEKSTSPAVKIVRDLCDELRKREPAFCPKPR